MGANRVLNNGNLDLDSARVDRENRTNQPEYAPGQEDDADGLFDDDNDLFEDTSVTATQSPVGGAPVGSFMQPMGQPLGQPMGQSTSSTSNIEDKVFDVVINSGKGVLSFSKDFIKSFQGLTPKFWSMWGSKTFVTSCISSVLGIIFLLFRMGVGVNFLIGGLISAGVSAMVLMLNIKEAQNYPSMFADKGTPVQPMVNNMSPVLEDAQEEELGYYEEDDDYYEEDYDEDYEEEDFSEGSEDSDFFSDLENMDVSEPVSQMSVDEAINTMMIPDNGLYTRQYLYEMFTKVLMNITPKYATVTKIDPDDDVFLTWEVMLRDACRVQNVKEENLPTLDSLEDSLFTIKLSFSRPTGFKPNEVANELARIYAYKDGEFDAKVYAKADLVGKNCIITVFTGETALVSLKDTYDNVKDFMLDTKNYIPVVLGINQVGKVIMVDFKKLESVLITGMPRSGKSWFVQAVLTQMCAFVPPSELNIYICDPKDGISDFKSFTLPHVKKFVSGDDNIVNTLRSVVKDLAPKRKKILGDAGFVNIWDYKERYPDVDMPIIYILIDEVVTLAERMEKETKKEFQGLLIELISQLPALGIRAFLIPHVVKNEIIAKTATDLINCRISVCGDSDHIESSTGTKAKDFVYKLANKGDMAVKMPIVSADTMFVHGVALSDSNVKNSELFDYLTRLWGKIEPEQVKTSASALSKLKTPSSSPQSNPSFINNNSAVNNNSTNNNSTSTNKQGTKVSPIIPKGNALGTIKGVGSIKPVTEDTFADIDMSDAFSPEDTSFTDGDLAVASDFKNQSSSNSNLNEDDIFDDTDNIDDDDFMADAFDF